MKETRRSLYDSELGVKKMAVGHHFGERSHTIERSHNLLSGKRVERKDFVNLGGRWVRVGLGPGWRFGCGTGELSGSGTRRSGVYASTCLRCYNHA